jgi:hypothetical protein
MLYLIKKKLLYSGYGASGIPGVEKDKRIPLLTQGKLN